MTRRALALLLPFAFAASGAAADQLVTPSFVVTIEAKCAEGNVTCDNVSYSGMSKKTGDAIRLKGRTVHAKCADGVTPCRFLGYEFRNGGTVYAVSEGGVLQVRQGGKTVFQETGEWKY